MKKQLVDGDRTDLSIRRQCQLLALSRGSLYYQPVGESADNLEMMRLMDAHILEEPTAGVITMQDMLEENGYKAGYERVRRLMRKAAIMPIYPRRQLTVLGEKKYIYPYLLKGLKIDRRNKVWAIDITYIPMKSGFMYMTAIIDVYSRFIVGWGLSNSLEAAASHQVIRNAIDQHGCPEILNSDQGVQFTCKAYVDLLKEHDIRISMDGKGRAIDNVFIERFWRTLKYQHVYLNPAEDGTQLYRGIQKWMIRYHNRKHQGINRVKPIVRYGLVG